MPEDPGTSSGPKAGVVGCKIAQDPAGPHPTTKHAQPVH